MEYIREMLLRQRTALARLMLGGAAEEPSETASAQAADRREAAVPAERGTGRSEMAAGWREVRRSAAADAGEVSAADTAAPAGETLRTALARKSAARQRAAASGLAGAGETALPLPSSRRQTAGGEVRSPGGGGSVRPGGDEGAETAGVLWEVQQPGAADAGDSAKALSRTFQRDARRYDGGFQLYD